MPQVPIQNIFDSRDDDFEGNEDPDLEPTTEDEDELESDIEEEDRERGSRADGEGGEDNELTGSEDEDANVEQGEFPGLAFKVEAALQYFKTISLKPEDFLVALSWGDQACTQDHTIRAARTSLLQSQKLSGIIRRWATPPRSKRSKKARAKGASNTLNTFALEHIQSTLGTEMKDLAKHLKSPSSVDVEEETFTETTFQLMSTTMRDHAPTLWSLIQSLATTPKQQQRNTHKNPEKTVIVVISMLLYSQSHHNCRLQKLLSIYLKFKGVSAKGFDTLHAMGLTMSHKWACDSVQRMSERSMEEVREKLKTEPWLITYDNAAISMRVFSQRVDKKTDFGSATAATVYVKRNAKPLSATANEALRQKRAEGATKPLTGLDIAKLAIDSQPRIDEQAEYEVLRFLLDSPAFSLKTYEGRKDTHLKPPTPVDALPCGPEHITLQYLLGTVNIPEASYEDNEKLVNEWLAQVGMGGKEETKKTATERIISWVGDQLTVDRLRGLFKYRAEDSNSFERMDYSIFVFGWFHCQMTFANSIHKQYFGTNQGRGLQQAFTLLQRKGLNRILTKGPFHHDLDETIYQIAAAHFREDWLAAGQVEDLAELRKKKPEELRRLAKQIVEMRASNAALVKHDTRPQSNQDEEFRQLVMFKRDVLQYLVLGHAIEEGDVGLMEHMLPHLYIRFSGGGHGNYAVEVLELLQGLHREWPDEIWCVINSDNKNYSQIASSDWVRHHCWLVNMTGKPGKFCELDKCQEHNIKDIKVTYRSQGPNIQWEYLKVLHPAIHVIRAVAEHVEKEFGTYTRGKKHTVPSKEKDIELLRKSYHEAAFNKFQRGRKIGRKGDEAQDYMKAGMDHLHEGKMLERWEHQRTFERSKDEKWDSGSSSDENGEETLTRGESSG